jgi:hypothetical protein
MKTALKAALIGTALLGAAPVFAEDTGVAAGSSNVASSVAAGSTATIVAVGIGTAAVIGAVVAGSSSNGTTSTTSTSK